MKELLITLVFLALTASGFVFLHEKSQVQALREQLEQCTAQMAHMRLLYDNRADCNLDRRLLALQTELQTLRLGIRGIAKECAK